MKKATYILLASAATFAVAERAAAQADVNPPAPNVLLLVDTSGSMEYRSSESSFPACDPTGATPSEKSRWIETVEVLTGTIDPATYRCQAVDRSSTAFRDEYSLGGTAPYDFQYENPYHRPLSGTCTPGPGTLPTNVFEFPADAIRFHEYTNPATACTSFTQASDGILDAFATGVRFGLMTFDTLTDAGRGYSGTSANHPNGIQGTWSYFLNQPRSGRPAGCNDFSDIEVGARNAAAPPWEGRMVAFGDPNAPAGALSAKNEQIQKILLAARPYGATPIAGMLHDARDFFWNDTSLDPLGSGSPFGPESDPYVNNECRKQSIILLTDGEPNLDLRPFCEGHGPPPGKCPFDKAEDIAASLANGGSRRVETYVIGFALKDLTAGGQPFDCNDLTDADLVDSGGKCAQNPDEKGVQICCTLHRIAFRGGTDRARFAGDQAELRAAFHEALSKRQPSTSRTLPVMASAAALRHRFLIDGVSQKGFRFYTSFVPLPFSVWQGVLERQRIECKTVDGKLVPQVANVERSKGDDFVANVNNDPSGRQFVSIVGDLKTDKIFSRRSMRPHLATDSDGIGDDRGTRHLGGAEDFSTIDPKAMAITDATCPGLSAAACRDKFMRWNVGLDNNTDFHRCPTPGAADCNLIGDIFHSTPQVVGRPLEFLRDESYQQFAAEHSRRPIVLYTSTNDGFLHAFKVAPENATDPVGTQLRNNELWAFIPPAVLPAIPAQYPGTHQILLDGVPVIKDVVAKEQNGGFVFERTLADAQSGNGTWRTVLIQGFGGSRGGYFALDVTDPVIKSGDDNSGPRFLWQLTEDSEGNALFGLRGATPIVTTLFFGADGNDAREVAVAILPGGGGGAPTGTACNMEAETNIVDAEFSPRAQVNCYPPEGRRAQSLTIVRLDTGEIIRTFRPSTNDFPGEAELVTVTKLPSPITGQPVAFPSGTGAVADRIFVGDSDGLLWKVDVASTDPTKWTMDLFFDAFPASLGHSALSGQPIATSPVLSVDLVGNVTIALSTGDQDVLTADPTMKNYVWSLTEKLVVDGDADELLSKVNWYQELSGGERVSGPMSLFGGALFFSTFTPSPPENPCSTGNSAVWGLDYLIASPAGRDQGGRARFPNPEGDPPFVQKVDATVLLQGEKATIFGVAVAQMPSCFETTDESFDDPFLRFGQGGEDVGSVTPGQFQLVMHTGSGGQGEGGSITNVLTFDLPSPTSVSRVDSWAGIIE